MDIYFQSVTHVECTSPCDRGPWVPYPTRLYILLELLTERMHV